MKKKLLNNNIFIYILLLYFILLQSCVNKDKFVYSNKFELRQLVKTTETNKSSSGYFFLITGRYSESTIKSTIVKMYVLADSNYNYLELNTEILKIRIDNNIQKPYLIIKYNNNTELSDMSDTKKLLYINSYFNSSTILVCPEKYLPEQLLPIIIN